MSSSVDNNHTDTTTTVNNEQKQQTDVNIKQVQSLLQIVQHSAAGPHIPGAAKESSPLASFVVFSATARNFNAKFCTLI